MFQYPAKITPALPHEKGFNVSFRDVPEAISCGETLEEAIHYASEVLTMALEDYLDERRKAPTPSPAQEGEHLISLPVSLSLKLELMNEMIVQGIRPTELARRLGTTRQEINRLTTLSHTTKVDRIAEAFQALGRRLEIHIA